MRHFLLPLVPALLLVACKDDYSANTYATRAVQQANRAEQGVVIGVRRVTIKPDGTTGATAGAAAGGVIGGTTGGGTPPSSGIGAALGAVGGALVGGLIGGTAERAAGETEAHEYIVRKASGDLVSVTQVDARPLVVGMRVLVISGAQARIVPDYTTQPPEAAPGAQRPATPTPPASAPTQEPAEPAAAAPTTAPIPMPVPVTSGLAAPGRLPPPVLVPAPPSVPAPPAPPAETD